MVGRRNAVRRYTNILAVIAGAATLCALVVQPAIAVPSRAITLSVPTSTTTGATMTIRGVLSLTPRGSLVAIRRKSGTSWVAVGYARTTDTTGDYSRWVKAPRSHGRYYYDAYAPAASHGSAATSVVHGVIVRTRVAISLGASASSPTDGRPITVSGGIAPWASGMSAFLQTSVGSGAWSTLSSLTPTASGRFSRQVTPTPDLRNSYRVVTRTWNYYAPTVSSTVDAFPKAPPFNWDPVTEPVVPAGSARSFQCPTSNFCMLAADQSYQTWSDGSWSPPKPLPYQMGGPNPSLSCANATSCMLVDWQSYAVYNGQSWTGPVSTVKTLPGTVFKSVACTSSAFCMATTVDGVSLQWNGSAWSLGPRFGTAGQGGYTDPVNCAAVNLCWAGIGPQWNGTSWAPIESGSPANTNAFAHMSCTSTAFCMYVDALGSMSEYTTANGWTSISSPWPAGTDTIFPDVACQSSTSCLSVSQTLDTGQATLVSTFNGSTWTTPVTLHSGTANNPLIACPTTLLCMEVDVSDRNGDEEITSYANGAWTAPTQVTHANYLDGVSCVHGGVCHALEYAGNVRTYDGTTWSPPTPIDSSGGAEDISCGTDTFCGVVDNGGGVVIEASGTWGPRQIVMPPGDGFFSISCTADNACMVTSNTGSVAQYNNAQWTTTTPSGGGVVGSVACGSASYCLDTSAQWWNGTAWAPSPSGTIQGGSAATCVSTTDCILASIADWPHHPNAFHLSNGTWQQAPTPIGPPNASMQNAEAASSIACVTASRCVSIVNGQLNTFSPGGVTLGPTILAGEQSTVSCARPHLCVATIEGTVSVGR
jgi:hypothetical protein